MLTQQAIAGGFDKIDQQLILTPRFIHTDAGADQHLLTVARHKSGIAICLLKHRHFDLRCRVF